MPRSEDRKKNFKMLTVEVTRAFDEILAQEARKRRISKGELVRNAISAYIRG